MKEFYRKECPYEGSYAPIPFAHLGGRGAIPKKCGACQFFFEGACKKISNSLLRLDYGPCGISGSKALVSDERVYRKIPEKCHTCSFLAEARVYKLICTKDAAVWGDFPRGLDF